MIENEINGKNKNNLKYAFVVLVHWQKLIARGNSTLKTDCLKNYGLCSKLHIFFQTSVNCHIVRLNPGHYVTKYQYVDILV